MGDRFDGSDVADLVALEGHHGADLDAGNVAEVRQVFVTLAALPGDPIEPVEQHAAHRQHKAADGQIVDVVAFHG